MQAYDKAKDIHTLVLVQGRGLLSQLWDISQKSPHCRARGLIHVEYALLASCSDARPTEGSTQSHSSQNCSDGCVLVSTHRPANRLAGEP